MMHELSIRMMRQSLDAVFYWKDQIGLRSTKFCLLQIQSGLKWYFRCKFYLERVASR